MDSDSVYRNRANGLDTVVGRDEPNPVDTDYLASGGAFDATNQGMTQGVREYQGASLRLVPLPRLVDNYLLQVVSLNTTEDRRKKGDARKLLRMTCEEADATGTVLILKPEPYLDAPMDSIALAAWYHRFGFECIQVAPVILMARKPRKAKHGTH